MFSRSWNHVCIKLFNLLMQSTKDMKTKEKKWLIKSPQKSQRVEKCIEEISISAFDECLPMWITVNYSMKKSLPGMRNCWPSRRGKLDRSGREMESFIFPRITYLFFTSRLIEEKTKNISDGMKGRQLGWRCGWWFSQVCFNFTNKTPTWGIDRFHFNISPIN